MQPSNQTRVTRARGRLAFDLQSPARPPRSACGTGPVICGYQQSGVLPSREAKQMGHLVTRWHKTGLVLFPRVHECVLGAPAGLATLRSETTCLQRFHVQSAAPYSRCMTQRDSADYVLTFFFSTSAAHTHTHMHAHKKHSDHVCSAVLSNSAV